MLDLLWLHSQGAKVGEKRNKPQVKNAKRKPAEVEAELKKKNIQEEIDNIDYTTCHSVPGQTQS